MVCGNFILPEPASYVFFYAISFLRNLSYIIEYRVMEVLWDSGPVSSTQLVSLCGERLDWNKSTTYTVLRRLKNKGLVRHQNTVVTPLVTREEVIRAQGEELVRRAGGLPLFMTAFLSGRKLTAQEAEELKELIDEKMGEG